MARPSAELLLEHIDDNMRSYAVCASAGICIIVGNLLAYA
jgi:hypothetical protein